MGDGEEDPASWEPWVVGVKGSGSEADSPHPSQWGQKMQPTQARPPSPPLGKGRSWVTGSELGRNQPSPTPSFAQEDKGHASKAGAVTAKPA